MQYGILHEIYMPSSEATLMIRGLSIKRYVDSRIEKLLCAECSVEDMVITKSLSKRLSAYKVNQPHVVFARKLTSRGIEVKAGTRLAFILKSFRTQAAATASVVQQGLAPQVL